MKVSILKIQKVAYKQLVVIGVLRLHLLSLQIRVELILINKSKTSCNPVYQNKLIIVIMRQYIKKELTWTITVPNLIQEEKLWKISKNLIKRKLMLHQMIMVQIGYKQSRCGLKILKTKQAQMDIHTLLKLHLKYLVILNRKNKLTFLLRLLTKEKNWPC